MMCTGIEVEQKYNFDIAIHVYFTRLIFELIADEAVKVCVEAGLHMYGVYDTRTAHTRHHRFLC